MPIRTTAALAFLAGLTLAPAAHAFEGAYRGEDAGQRLTIRKTGPTAYELTFNVNNIAPACVGDVITGATLTGNTLSTRLGRWGRNGQPEACVLTVRRTAQGLLVEDRSCNRSFSGPRCGFDGRYTRR